MSQSTHRLPTITGFDALQQANDRDQEDNISLGPKNLDALFSDPSGQANDSSGGIFRGELTEIIGPPGIGKTQLCLQAAAATLVGGKDVLWIDTATIVPGIRLQALLSPAGDEECLSNFRHYMAPTLSHVIGLLLHSPSGLLSNKTGLVVIDSLSASIDSEYPRGTDELRSTKTETSRWNAGRRQATQNDIGSRLAKLAAVHNTAMMVVSNTVTHVRAGSEASLRPALAGDGWESSVNNRIYLYRDWLPVSTAQGQRKNFEAARIALRVEKSSNTARPDNARSFAAFRITNRGLEELDIEMTSTVSASPERLLSHASRKRDRTDIESGDESSQEYGWGEDDQLAAEGLVDASFM